MELPEPTLARTLAEEPTGAIPHAHEHLETRSPSLETNSDELFTEASVFAKYGLTDKAIAHLHRLLSLNPDHPEGRRLLAELGGGVVEEVAADPAPAPLPAVRPEPRPLASQRSAFRLDLESLVVPSPPPARRPATPSAARTGLGRVRLEELEAMLGFDGPGRVHRAAPPAPPEAQPGGPEGGLAEAQWEPAAEVVSFEPAPPGPAQAEFNTVAAEPIASDVVPDSLGAASAGAEESIPEEPAVEFLEVPDLLAGPSEEQLRELDFFIEQGLREDAARQLSRLQESFGDHPAVLARHALLKSRGWDETDLVAAAAAGSASELFSEEEQFFNLAAELERELAEDELVAEARGEARDEAEEESIEELFREFQRGVAEQLSDEDYDTHFNLGLAYREMGLLDEAIGEFQLAVKSPALYLEAVSMIGACYVEKGLHDEAAGWYAKGLEAPDLPAEVEVGLHYELGRALEAGGSTASALTHYAEVLARNPTFRDVVSRVERLRLN